MAPTYNNTARFGFRIPQANQKINDFTAIIDALGNDVANGTTGWVAGATGTVTAGTAGRMFRDTTTGILYFDDGSKLRVLPTLAPARGYRAAGGGVSFGGGSGIAIDTISFDDEGAFSGGFYVCKRPGKYHVMGQTAVTLGAAGVTSTLIYKNGSPATQGAATDGSAGQQVYTNVADVVSCALNDTLSLIIDLLSSANGTLNVGPNSNYLTVVPLC